MIIKVLEKITGCMPVVIDKGDWIDLCTSEQVELYVPKANKMHIRNKGKSTQEVRVRDVDFSSALIPLGIAMELPKGYEAILAPRSSSFKHWGIIQTNSIGVIDNSFSSDNDEWKLPIIATRNTIIPKGTRIAQFRIQLSQGATFWQKVKWLFSSQIRLKKVESLSNETRGGFGSTGY